MSGDLDQLRQRIAELERAKQSQPARLAEARNRAEFEKQNALASEPWSDMVTGLPPLGSDGDLNGMFSMPTIDGKELFGTRLAFDLLGCCGDQEQVSETLTEYFTMIREPGHAFLVALAALKVIANYVVTPLFDIVERQASNYDARVWLADAAGNAWAARAGDLAGDGVAE